MLPDLQMVKLLLALGADIDIRSSNGKTAIDLLSGNKRSAEFLRQAMEKRPPAASK
jgi:ankyrin repeat protein